MIHNGPGGGSGADGADLLVSVERLQFADFTINLVGNDAPIAVDDAVALTEDAGVYSSGSASVLDNDIDFDGDTLTVTPGVFNGTYGTLTLNANGTYSYTLNATAQTLAQGQVAQDNFSYTVSDGSASDTGTLTFNITGTNDAPVAVADTNSGDPVVESGVNPGNTPFPGDASAAGNVLANDTDVDTGDTKTVSAVNGSAVNVGAAVAGTYGSVTIASNGSYTYTLDNADPDTNALAQGASVTDVFTYTVQDANGATSTTTLTITITGTNDAPVRWPTPIAATRSSNPGSIRATRRSPAIASAAGNVLANDTDVDTGDTKTVSAVNGSAVNVGAPVAGTYGSVTIAADGSYTYTLDNADPDTNALAQGESVDDVFTYTVTDANGATSTTTLTVTITGTNDAPTIDAGGTDDSGSVTELPNNDPNENAFTHTDSGTVDFDDVDVPDTPQRKLHAAGRRLSRHVHPRSGRPGGRQRRLGLQRRGQRSRLPRRRRDADPDLYDRDRGRQWRHRHPGRHHHHPDRRRRRPADRMVYRQQRGRQRQSRHRGRSLYLDRGVQRGAGHAGRAAGRPHRLSARRHRHLYAEADGINLLDDQILIGVADGTRPADHRTRRPPATASTSPRTTPSPASTSATPCGADIADSGGSVGTLTISDVGSSGIGQIVDIDQGGTLNVTLNSAESLGSAGGAIDLAGIGGSFTVTGATTITGVHSGGGIDITGSSVAASFAGGGSVATLTTTAVNFVGNSGTLELGGGFDIVTTSGAGFNASGGGTVTVTGAGNSMATTAVRRSAIAGTDIGLAGVTFESIQLERRGQRHRPQQYRHDGGRPGGLTVTGDAGSAVNGSGGTIGSSTGVGISLTNTRDVSLDQMNVQSGSDDGIRGSNVTNFSLTNATIANNGDASTEHGAEFANLLGTGTFTNVAFTNNETSQLSIINNSGTASVALTNVTATSTGVAAAPNGLHGLHFETQGSATADLTVLNSAFDNLFSNSVNAINQGTGTLEVTVANTTFDNVGASAINIVQSSSGTTRFYIHDNPTFLRGTNNGVSASININQAGGRRPARCSRARSATTRSATTARATRPPPAATASASSRSGPAPPMCGSTATTSRASAPTASTSR